MYSTSHKSFLKRRFFSDETIEFNQSEKRQRKEELSPIAIDELYNIVSPRPSLLPEEPLELSIIKPEKVYSTDKMDDWYENNSSSTNSLEVNQPFLNDFDFVRDMNSIPCCAHVHQQVFHYTERLLIKRDIIHESIYHELIIFLEAIKQNLFLESNDFILMEFFDAVDIFFETYVDSTIIEELQLENFSMELNRLKRQLESSGMIGFPLEDEDAYSLKFG